MVNSEEESNLSNKHVRCFLVEEFENNIKFSKSNRKNESQFVFPEATKVDDFINSLLNINAVKSAAEVIKESLLEVKHNLDGSFCETQNLYTNPHIADNSSTAEFITGCFQNVLLHKRVGGKESIPSWVCVKSLISKCHQGYKNA